jgi:hypothetical protein
MFAVNAQGAQVQQCSNASDGHAATSFSGLISANGLHELQEPEFVATGGHTLTISIILECLRQNQEHGLRRNTRPT